MPDKNISTKLLFEQWVKAEHIVHLVKPNKVQENPNVPPHLNPCMV